MVKPSASTTRPGIGPAPRGARGRLVPEVQRIVPARALAFSAVLLLALTAACDHDQPVASGPPGPHGSPTSAGECRDLPLVGGDGGMVLGTDWTTETHPYDQLVDLTVCVTTSDSGVLRVTSSEPGVSVTPRTQQVAAAGNGLLTVQVRVAPGTPSGTPLRIVQHGDGPFGDTPGPAIATTPEGWHFDTPG